MKWQVTWTDGNITKKHDVFHTLEEAKQSIYDWWEENKFTPQYVRVIGTEKNDKVTLDYGSHHMFYHIIKIGDGNG